MRRHDIDVKELLKAELYNERGYSLTGTGLHPCRPCPPGALPYDGAPDQRQYSSESARPARIPYTLTRPDHGFENIEVYLDSNYANPISDRPNGELRWSIPPLNSNHPIDTCVEIAIQPFYFPRIASPPTKPDIFYYRRVYLEILQTSATQSITGSNNIHYHFELQVENVTGQAVRLIPIRESIYFAQPLTSLTEFQIRFSVPPLTGAPLPLRRLPLPIETTPATLVLVAGAGTNPARFTIADTSILGNIGTLGAPGVAIVFSGFATAVPAVDTQINDILGNFATTVISATIFEVPINATAVTVAATGLLYVPKNRIALSARFTSLRNTPTNYVSVHHS